MEALFNFRNTFRRKTDNERDKDFKCRKREYYFWSKLMRETVELYGSSLTDSKISIFYVTISPAIIFNQFCVRFCMPTSTTSSLQIVSMCTNNGLILELKSTSEIASFYQGLLNILIVHYYLLFLNNMNIYLSVVGHQYNLIIFVF